MNEEKEICYHPKEKRNVRISLTSEDAKKIGQQMIETKDGATAEMLSPFEYALCLACGKQLL